MCTLVLRETGASSLSGRAFDPDAPEFSGLSDGLKEDIQHALYR